MFYGGALFGAFSGVASSGSLDGQGPTVLGTAGTALALGSLTPSVGGCLVITAIDFSVSVSGLTAPAGYTMLTSMDQSSYANLIPMAWAYKIKSAGDSSTESPTWTWTGSAKAAATLAVFKPMAGSAPAVTTDPANASVTQPATANFTATATDSTSLQWQYSSDGGTTWASVTDGTGGNVGTTSGSYTTAATAVSSGTWRNGYKVRCAFTNTTGTTYSTAATLTVTGASAVGTVRAYYENLKGSRNV